METQIEAIQTVDNSPLMSNSCTVGHHPGKFILDFKSIYEQYAPDGKATPVINHKTILMDPYMAKMFLDTLTTNVQNYEKKFGEIKKPIEMIKAEQEVKILQKENTNQIPYYLG